MSIKDFLLESVSSVPPGDFLSLVGAIIGVACTRVLYWAEKRRRLPTIKETLLEPFTIVSLGLFSGLAAQLVGIDNQLVVSGIGAVFGRYGPHSIDLVVEALAHKMGVRPCTIELKDRDADGK